MTTLNTFVRLEVDTDLSIFEAENNLNLVSSVQVASGPKTSNPDFVGTSSSNNTICFTNGEYIEFPDIILFAGSNDDFYIEADLSFPTLEYPTIFSLGTSSQGYIYVQVVGGTKYFKLFGRSANGDTVELDSTTLVNTTDSFNLIVERISGIVSLKITKGSEPQEVVSASTAWNHKIESTGAENQNYVGLRILIADVCVSNFILQSEAEPPATTTVAPTTTPCPEPNPTPDCENGTLVPIYHPITQCLIGYNCVEDTITSTTTRHPQSCEVEDKNCFREEHRTRRIRAVPLPSPYQDYVSSTTTTTTTTTTTEAAYPSEYLDVLVNPNNDIFCPALDPPPPPMYFDAFGGDEIFPTGDLIVHKFYNNGVFQIVPYTPSTFTSTEIQFILVGGGGGGGLFRGGGGGGGGEVKQSTLRFPQGGFTINIGKGGGDGINGEKTSIVELGVHAQGGGAGGSSFEDNASNGSNGGGAGGKSNSEGGLGFGGNSGGSSTGQYGGGGGGGAGSSGQSSPVLSNNAVVAPAGEGGTGRAVTIDKKTYYFYGGGGAGSDFEGFVVPPSTGGGGSTNQPDGSDNTGGGGAGNGGEGGSGYCLIAYVPVTTPAPTTTTTRPPTVPDPVLLESVYALFDSITVKWLDPPDPGTAPISEYKIIVKVHSTGQVVYDLDLPADSVSNELNQVKEYLIESLSTETIYDIELYASNSVGMSLPTYTSTATVSTTTTTTTVDPDGVSFIIDFQGDITDGFIGNDSISINGPTGTIRNSIVQIISNENKYFYSLPEISLFGDGVPNIIASNISMEIGEDNTFINVIIPVLMPERPETRSLVYLSVEAIDATTTSTTTTTTTLPPLCLSLYDEAEFVWVEPVEANEEEGIEAQDGKYIHPEDDARFLKPLQFVLSKEIFPYEITGSASSTSNLPGDPWYNGKYFELARSVASYQDYTDSLPIDHNKYLLISTNENGSQNLLTTDKYILKYPTVRGDNSINYSMIELLIEEVAYRLELRVVVDFNCSLTNVTPHGQGDEDISGFFTIEIKEVVDNISSNILYSKIIQDNFNFRTIDNFTSEHTGEIYYFMLDLGTREKIVGI